MKSKFSIIIVVLVVVCIILLLVAGTRSVEDEIQDLTKQSFSYKDKKPGGCYALFQVLPHLYTNEPVKVVTKPFSLTYKKNQSFAMGEESLYILVTKKLYASEQDVTDMLQFAANGNQLFIAMTEPDSLLQARLAVEADTLDRSFSMPVSTQHYINPNLAPDTVFTRKGIVAGRYFTSYDTSATTILGTGIVPDSSTGRAKPNFIRVAYGKGAVFLLLNPSSLTNYFLMHEPNMASLEKQLAYTYNIPTAIYWDEYYKYLNGPRGDFSEWQVLMRYPAIRWALWLVVALLLLYVLFEGKRRQRIIPEKEVLTNNSLEFVETLGQLYYQQGNNRNLAHKMVLHWTEYIRTRFYLNTTYLNQAFIDTLTRKSGLPYADVREIVDSIHHIQLSEQINDKYLEQFYKNIHQFYQNTK